MTTNDLIMQHQNLVHKIAQRWVRSNITFNDLVQEGNLGLLEAANRFDPSRGTQFSTYATPWVKKFIRAYVADFKCSIAVSPTSKNDFISQVDLEDGMDSLPIQEKSHSDLSDLMHFFLEKEHSFICFKESPEENTSTHEALKALNKAIDKLSTREARIIRQHFGLGGEIPQTLEEIGDGEVCRERVRQIEEIAMRKIRRRLCTKEFRVFSKKQPDA